MWRELLQRTDKWFLGGGQGLVFAPEVPLFLDVPGFWDAAYYLDHTIEPGFTLTLLDEEGREIRLRASEERSWLPHRLAGEYTRKGLVLTEERCVTPGDVLGARYTLRNLQTSPRRLHLILWTAQPLGTWRDHPRRGALAVRDAAVSGEILRFTHDDRNPKGMRLEKGVALGSDLTLDSYSVNLSQLTENAPRWILTPFYEKFRGRLPDEVKADPGVAMDLLGIPDQSLLYMGLHYIVYIPADGIVSFQAGMAVAPTPVEAGEALRAELAEGLLTRSEAEWEGFFATVPAFTCDDPYLERYYWYRWYGLRLNRINVRRWNLPYPCIGEGPNPYYFRRNISYSAPCHMMECRWLPDPEIATGSLANFLHNQDEEGRLPASIGATENLDYLIYHANWGWALEELRKVHTLDAAFLKWAYDGLSRYARYFDRERDPEGSGLYDVQNHFETGQEYHSRYLFTDQAADGYSWYDSTKNIHLKGVDATVYLYELQRVLAELAASLQTGEEGLWKTRAARTRSAILQSMWDPDRQLFFDVDPRTGNRSPYRSLVSFYPFMTDITGVEHLDALHRHLLDPASFWTPYPAPTASLDDPNFSAEAEWRGKRHICPWNGRVWPMTNSHLVEALVRASELDPSLRQHAAGFLNRFIRMMFFDGDPARPNCFEHYNPFTAAPSAYRGADDYMHSWVVDLIIKYAAGLRPLAPERIALDPLPLGLGRFSLTGVSYQGHRLDILYNQDGNGAYVLRVDGKERVRREGLGRVEVQLKPA